MTKGELLPAKCKMRVNSKYASDSDCDHCGLGEGEACPDYTARSDARMAQLREVAAAKKAAGFRSLPERLRDAYDEWNHPDSESLPEGAGVVLEAATALSEQAARIEALELELDAVKAFGVGFYAPNVEEATREAYRSIARRGRTTEKKDG